jgi:hypothetical protein
VTQAGIRFQRSLRRDEAHRLEKEGGDVAAFFVTSAGVVQWLPMSFVFARFSFPFC